MSVNPKQKRELSSMWDGAKEAGGSNVPDGTYRFKFLKSHFEMGTKPCFKQTLEVTGGAEEMVGETLEIRDNLETAENMGWFKSKLARLNMADVTFDDIENGTLSEQLKGKVFEGQAKTKGGFLNVYVNRLIAEGDAGDEKKPAKEEGDEKPEKKEKGSDFAEGDEVAWTTKDGEDKSGEVVEVLEDEGLVRVKKEDGSVVRVKIESLSKAGGKAKEEKGGKGDDQFVLPEPEKVDDMTMGEVKDCLKKMDFDPAELKSPRAVLHAFCVLGNDPEAKIELEEVSPLAAALEVELEKGASFKESLKLLSKAVQKRLG